MGTLHRLISAIIDRMVTHDLAELPILPRWKWCVLALLNIVLKFPKETFFVRFVIKIQHIYVFRIYDL